jgi:MFS family permease
LISIVGIIGLIFGVVAGPFIARTGMARILVLSLLVGAGMSGLQITLPRVEIFALSRIIEGFSHLGIVIAGPTLIATNSADKDRPLAMGVWASFFGASLAVTAFYLPSILNTGGLPMLFGLHAGGMLAIATVLMFLLPKIAPEPILTPRFITAYRTLYTSPNLLLPGAGFVWYTGIYIALIAVLPLALSLTPASLATIPLISIAGTLGAGVVAKRIPPDHLSIVGFIASAVLIIAIWLGFTALPVIYALFFLMGAIPTGAFAAIGHFNTTTTDRARATGGITHFGNIGTTLGTPIMVIAFQFAGMTGIMVMVVLCCLGGVVSLRVLSPRNP